MTALIPYNDQSSLITRRSIVIGAAASLFCAPAIVRVANLMAVRKLPFPYGPQYAGYVDRLFLHSIESSLKACLRAGRTIVEVGDNHKIPLERAQQTVAFAQAHGPPRANSRLKSWGVTGQVLARDSSGAESRHQSRWRYTGPIAGRVNF
jgi:hypothetical protein